ncbi:MAG TPA: hypothetical protein PKM17_13015 [Syntrophorhabdus sp.]|nr:hypothetical protein [Syntrophorhabdus sp.]
MNITPGTIIKRRISGIFWHMGVYISRNKVIHYHNPTPGKDKGILGKSGATIRMESLEKFAEGGYNKEAFFVNLFMISSGICIP